YWSELYNGPLAQERPGLTGAALGRMDVLLLRLSVAYALLDRAELITRAHLEAAHAVVAYSERTVLWLLGAASGNRYADELLDELARVGRMTRGQVRDFFGRNMSGDELDTVRGVLIKQGRLRVLVDQRAGRGRRTEVWEYRA